MYVGLCAADEGLHYLFAVSLLSSVGDYSSSGSSNERKIIAGQVA